MSLEKEQSQGKLMLQALKELYGMSLRIRPQLFVFILLTALFATANTLLTIYIPKLVIDGLGAGWDFQTFLPFVGQLFVLKIFLIYLTDLLDQRVNHESALFYDQMQIVFSDKIMKLRYEYLEDPEALEKKEEALAPIQYGYIFTILQNTQTALSSLLTFLGIAGILLSFSPLLFILITAFSLIGLMIEKKISQAFIEFQQDLVPINRKYNYYIGELLAENRQKEFRLYGVDDILVDRISLYNREICELLLEVLKIQANANSISTLFNVLGRFILYTYAGLRVLGIWGSSIFLGDFSLLIGANENYASSLRQFGLALTETLLVLPTLIPFMEFLHYEEMDETLVNKKESLDKTGQAVGSGKLVKSGKTEESVESEIVGKPVESVRPVNSAKPGKLQSLSFDKVSFKYPKTDKWILEDVSFQLDKGETLAIVGRNNAGKSTIVKLICRLFEPNQGRILWNGVDIRDFSYADYLDELACVFQDFKLFPLRIWENISCQWTEEDMEEVDVKIPEEIESRVWEVLARVKMKDHIQDLPYGLNTWLDKTLNEHATDFSGGQKQKLAIARAIYPDSSVAILDEPTASLDPLAESEVYGHFSDLVQGKTAIFISHRMSASRFCDRILVLEDGHITGNGSHKELIQTNDLYRDLYEAQAQYYE